MIETSKNQQIQFIFISKKKFFNDVENVTFFHEFDDITFFIDDDVLSFLQKTDSYEMMTFVKNQFENQNSQNRKKNDNVRSIIFTISLDSRRA